MREVSVTLIEQKIAEAVQEINFEYNSSIFDLIQVARNTETEPNAQKILDILIENAAIASKEQIPICQDTGMVVIFVKLGQEVKLIGGSFNDAIQKGVARGYKEGYLRNSIVADPLFKRDNTQNNTPAIIYTQIVEGDRIELSISCKGFGSENMSNIKMLYPAKGLAGVKNFVLETVKKAGASACPPMVIGVGIGGTFDYVAVLAKQALLTDKPNANPLYRQLEEELLEEINELGIGPQGLGGSTTALMVRIVDFPTHIAGLPVAVNISCHINRHREIII